SDRISIGDYYFSCLIVKVISSVFGYVISIIAISLLDFNLYVGAVISTLILFKTITILTIYNITVKKEKKYFFIGVFSTSISFIMKLMLVLFLDESNIPYFYIIDMFVLFTVAGGVFLVEFRSVRAKYLLEIFGLVKLRIYFILSSFSIVAFGKVDQILLAKMMTLENVANYALAMKVVGIFVLMSSAFNLSFSRELSISRNDNERYINIIRNLMFFTIFLGVLFSVLNFYISPLAINVFYGDKFNQAIYIVRLLSPLILLIFISSSIGRVLVAEELGRIAFTRNFLGLSFNFVLNLMLIPYFGIDGVIVSALLSWVLSLIIVFIFSHRMRSLFFRSIYVK
ncbi:polysaccharide biosynthesis C-terminal domain-containing protein, partial [Vibrio splendidus]